MRGSPLLRLGGLCVGLLLLAWPVVALTSRRVEPPPIQPAPGSQNAATTFEVRLTASSTGPLQVGIAGDAPRRSETGGEFSTTFEMNRHAPEDLMVDADFGNSDTPSAVRVEVLCDGRRVVDTTLWGKGRIEDAVAIPVP